MPKQKDLKRLVRGRMQKTGESYTSARSHILRTRRPSLSPAGPAPSDYAKLAGMSDEAVRAKTGCTWERWVGALDDAGAQRMSHREIAAYVHEHFDVSGWWAQTVTVGYERIRGLREIGQRRDGSFEANKSKTVGVPVKTLARAFTHAATRKRWLPAKLAIRSAAPDKSVRMTWEDGSLVEATFTMKGARKSQVAIQHRKLPDRASVARMKSYWAERLTALAEQLHAS